MQGYRTWAQRYNARSHQVVFTAVWFYEIPLGQRDGEKKPEPKRTCHLEDGQ